MRADALAAAREFHQRCQWQAAHDAAQAAHDAGGPERPELLAEAAWWLGRLDECVEQGEAAYHRCIETGQARRAGGNALRLHEHHMFRGRPAAATGWLQRARRLLADDPDCVEHGALRLREAEAAHGEGDLDQAVELAEQARDLGHRHGSDDLEADALQAIGRHLIDKGNPGDGLAHLDEAMLLAVEGRLGPYATGKVYCSLVSACEELGDLQRAAEWTEATARWAERHPFTVFPGVCRIHRAVTLDRQGALADAEQEAARACAELAGIHRPNAAVAFAQVGDMRRRLGDLDRAEDAFARVEELSGEPCAGLALLRLVQGDVDAAERIVRRCVDGRRAASPFTRLQLLPAYVQIAVAAGDLTGAAGAAAELEALAEDMGAGVYRAAALTARGRLELAREDLGAACTTLEHALAGWRELGIPYEVATARALLAETQSAAGDEVAAIAAFDAAEEQFERMGARLDARRVRHRRQHRRLPAGLTVRELEVLQLVAAGYTNKEIATALHIAGKTVSRHLSNIFTKLEVSSRAAATAFAYEHNLVVRG